jgi:hypothetical protein
MRNASLPHRVATAEIVIDHHDKGVNKLGDPFVAEVRIRNTSDKDVMLGGASGVVLETMLSFDAGATPSHGASQPLPLRGLLPGEESRILVVLPTFGATNATATISFSLAGRGLRAGAAPRVRLEIPVR